MSFLTRLAPLAISAVAVAMLSVGCALNASVTAERSINNTLAARDRPSFVVYPMDPRAEHAVEFRSLAISLTRELIGAGFKESVSKPDTLFLVGYSMELAQGGAWDRTLVVYGYDVASGRRVYQATIKSGGQIASAYEIGDVFFQSLARDIGRQGEIKDKVTYRYLPRS